MEKKTSDKPGVSELAGIFTKKRGTEFEKTIQEIRKKATVRKWSF